MGVSGKELIIELLKPLMQFVKTITFDNGKEFTKHMDIASTLEYSTYFAKPYYSWQRGQNENANGLLRQYFTKGMEFINLIRKEVIESVPKLNSRPRKCLNWATPYEAFKELTGIDAIILVKGIRLWFESSHNYSIESGNYIVRNDKFYTRIMNELIDAKSSRHIVFKGHNFYIKGQ